MFYFKFSCKNKVFEFKDLLKLIPIGLDKLLKDFDIKIDNLVVKLPFNYDWINENNIYYKGSLPSWLIGYEKELNDLGFIKLEEFTIKSYCEVYNKMGTVGLYHIIEKHSKIFILIIYNKYYKYSNNK